MTERRRRGPNDPHRRERIARAAVDVVAAYGVEGLTHRRVAEAAEVPLGSTTYHFRTLDELLEVALAQVVEASTTDLRAWAARLEHAGDIGRAAADLVVRRTGPDRARTVVHYELYLAALRRPNLKALCSSWSETFIEVFQAQYDRRTAHALAATLDGLMLESLITGDPIRPADANAVVSQVLGGASGRRTAGRGA